MRAGLSEELFRVASDGKHNGYANTMGVTAARLAIADTIRCSSMSGSSVCDV